MIGDYIGHSIGDVALLTTLATSRNLSQAMVEQITGDSLRPILMVRAEFDSGNINFWSGIGTKDYDGETYAGSGHLLTMGEVKETSNIEAVGTRFTLSGIPTSLTSTIYNEDYQGRPVYAYFGVVDNSGNIIESPYLIFKGFMDTIDREVSGETMTIVLNAENELIDLLVPRTSRFTPEDQKAKYPNDKGFDQITDLLDKEITWGSKSPTG